MKAAACTPPHQRPSLRVETPPAKGCEHLLSQTLASPPWPPLNWQPVWGGSRGGLGADHLTAMGQEGLSQAVHVTEHKMRYSSR